MKRFTNFLIEARETSASAEAKRLGLTGDGHGGWYDKNGEFVAKTVKGKLKFFGRDNIPGQKDSPAQPQPAAVQPQAVAQEPTPVEQGLRQSAVQRQVPPEQQQEPASQEIPAEIPVPETPGVVVVFGRFNPPTIGHEKLLKRAAKEAEKRGYELRIYPSRSQDAKKNPLTPQMKISYMRQMFPDYADSIVDDKGAKTIFNVLTGANEEGHNNMIIMVGQDRLGEFQGLSHKYNGELYNYDQLEVVSAGDRDPDSDDVSGMSASKLRLAAAEGDFVKFAKGVPNTLGNMEKKELFNVLRRSMNIEEGTEVWKIAPKLDEEGLRNAYLENYVYEVGNIVENMNTGFRGEVIRRGTNYVICVTEDGLMFKSWLRDLIENPHEIGTDEYREYLQLLTPGQEVKSYTGVKIASIYDKFRKGKKNK